MRHTINGPGTRRAAAWLLMVSGSVLIAYAGYVSAVTPVLSGGTLAAALATAVGLWGVVLGARLPATSTECEDEDDGGETFVDPVVVLVACADGTVTLNLPDHPRRGTLDVHRAASVLRQAAKELLEHPDGGSYVTDVVDR